MTDSELDKWGRLFDMERLPGETDYSFRDRITAYFLPRTCIREEYMRHPVYDGSVVHTWTFHYSDHTKETITKREFKR